MLFAVSVNDKLPWFIIEDTPAEFTAYKFKDRNPSNRYYMTEYI